MQRRARAWVAALAVFGLVGFLLARRAGRPRPVEGPSVDDGRVRVAGVLHVHSTLSDGGGTPEEIVAAAHSAGLGFVVITDHNNLDARAIEGVHDGVLALVGSEISTNAGHVLGLGLGQDPAFRFSGDVSDALDDVRHLGGFAVAAHPGSPRQDLRFTAWDHPGPWGVEIVNGDSQWRSGNWGRRAASALLYAFSPRGALLQGMAAPSDVLRRWDALLAERDARATGGSDAHSRLPITRRFALRIPSYEDLFHLVRTYVVLDEPLTGRFEADRDRVLAALRAGRSYVAVEALADAGQFSFEALAGTRRWTLGETLPPQAELTLRAAARKPAGAQIRILRDGQAFAQGTGHELLVQAPEPGVYRVEVWLPGQAMPWILSNPIYVFGEEAAVRRRERAAWPVPGPAPGPALVVEDFEQASSFNPEFDGRSWMATPVEAPGEGAGGSAAGRLAFRLGAPDEAQPYTWCALVNREHRDLSGRHGLVFSIRADGVYRLWVQVRDANPASADEGTEWWFASVRTSSQWQRVALPFDRFRSINPASDGRLDLDVVRGLVFVLDAGADKPGTEGTIWLDDIALW